MKVLFMGTPKAAVPSLEAIAASDHRVVGVACQPDRPAHRGQRLTAPPVKDAALAHGYPVLQPESLRPAAAREELASLQPDILVVVAYGRILGPRTLALARHGAINLHFSLLPRWRGAAPVQRAILAGDAQTGTSIIRIVEELDAGPVLASEAEPIQPEDTTPALEQRLAISGARLLVVALDALATGVATEVLQDARLVTLASPISKDEGWLDPSRPARELSRAVRAFTPWPGTRLRLASGAVGVVRASARDRGVPQPSGTLLPLEGDAVPVACGEGVLLLETVKPEGRAAMTARAAVNGRFLVPGERALPSSG